MIASADAVFGADGLLSQRFPGYTPRAGQVAMARAVESTLRDGGHLVVEGPTGTGKSLAYGAPAARMASEPGRRAVFVTANIALQEQLVTKDLPLLAEILPCRFTYSLLKGLSNYLCRLRLGQKRYGGVLHDAGEEADSSRLHDIEDWAERTENGDVSELPFQPPGRLWAQFSVTSEDCKGTECPFADGCYGRQAMARARQADIIVTNYHLLFAQLLVKEATGQDIVLPALDVVVLDEAHKAADIAREFFGWSVSNGAFRRLSRAMAELGESGLADNLERLGQAFCADLLAHRRSPVYRIRLRQPGVVEAKGLLGLLDRSRTVFTRAEADAREAEQHDKANEHRRFTERCERTAARITAALALQDDNLVVFIEEDQRGKGVLRARELDVSARLRARLFGAARSVVVTSATLSTGGSFDLVERDLGIPEPRRLVVPSPFDFRRQALLIVPDDMPDPNDQGFPPAVASHVELAIRLARGRTLGLFTSYRNLDATWRFLKDRGCDYRLLRQGEAPRTALIQAFREDVPSVLLGTESFWAGVDVPGEALSCVVIDRLPFPNPDDPVLDAIRERDPAWFLHYGLPRAVIAFKQGLGRLIRHRNDRGVVVVLDRRLVVKPYGSLFLRGLGDLRLSHRMEHIRTQLGGTP